ncbi:hypothetical protein JIN85_17890 [Luteolibacter pohnpeiensis]|uniref:Uncharacterized protein n=1 Tax=Luteolibacter pohnpeiensis TaxID=454153 RepID=A0A934SB71_9BACT|nr:hypothetical protein [Luteolibacter pohnpeiensis]MBK1884296.1 hypothetical protein [Luteolibacter pohnpeiensis]
MKSQKIFYILLILANACVFMQTYFWQQLKDGEYDVLLGFGMLSPIMSIGFIMPNAGRFEQMSYIMLKCLIYLISILIIASIGFVLGGR